MALRPLILKAGESLALAASRSVSKVPSQIRLPFLVGSRISAAYFPQGLLPPSSESDIFGGVNVICSSGLSSEGESRFGDSRSTASGFILGYRRGEVGPYGEVCRVFDLWKAEVPRIYAMYPLCIGVMSNSTPENNEAPKSSIKSEEEEEGCSYGSETVLEEKAVSVEETMRTEEKRIDKERLEDEASSNDNAEFSRSRVDRFVNDYKRIVQKALSSLVRWLVVPLVLSSMMNLLKNEKLHSQFKNDGVDSLNFLSLRRMEEMETSIKMSIQELRNDVEAIRHAAESMQEEITRLQSVAVEIGSIRDGLKRFEREIVAARRSLQTLEGNSCNVALKKDPPAQNSNDEVLDMARKIVEEEVEKHAADGLGLADYALSSGGATVLRHSEPRYPKAGANNFTVHPDAINMLQPSFGEPGQCFPLKGQSGFIDIHLTAEIIPESLTLEHVHHRVAYERQSAPKDCKVSAWHAGNITRVLSLLNFTYELDGNNRQTFTVDGSSLQSSGKVVVNVVRFEFLSNYGANHTCVYRFRIHGRIPDTAPESTNSASGISANTATVILHLVVAISVSMAIRIIV